MPLSMGVLLLIFQYLMLAVAQMCSNIDLVSIVQPNSHIDSSTYLTINNIGVMRCAKQCLMRRRCRSFNYDPATLTCSLNSLNSSETTTSAASGVSSDIGLWPETFLGECQGHACALTEQCEVTGGVAVCVTNSCSEPPGLYWGTVHTNGQVVWDVDEIASYSCNSGYVRSGTFRCRSYFTWQTGKCIEDD